MRPGDYPLPAHCAYIWFDGANLRLQLPPDGPESHGNTVILPLERLGIVRNEAGAPRPDQRGWLVLLDVLRARLAAADRRIGTQASPVQYDIEAVLRGVESAPSVAERKRAKSEDAEQVLRDAGLL